MNGVLVIARVIRLIGITQGTVHGSISIAIFMNPGGLEEQIACPALAFESPQETTAELRAVGIVIGFVDVQRGCARSCFGKRVCVK